MLPYLSMDMYMFQEVNYELQETDSVQGQVINYKYVFAPNGSFCDYHQIFLQCIRQISTSKSLFIAFQSSPCLYQQKNISLLLQQQEKSLPTRNTE